MATSKVTRSSPEVWLLGKAEAELSGSHLPTNGDVLRNFAFSHCEQKLPINQSTKAVIEAALKVWDKARIPTQRADNCQAKLKKLYEAYTNLKKSHFRQDDCVRAKEVIFKSDLDDLFDISTKNALSTMKNDEDKEFLCMQRADPQSSSMAGVDQVLTKQETRKRMREACAQSLQLKEMERQSLSQLGAACPLNSANDDSSFSDDSAEHSDFRLPSSSSAMPPKRQRTKTVITSEVAAAMDRVQLTDRRATFVTAAIVQALGYDLDNVSLSRNTIHRARVAARKSVASAAKDDFAPTTPLLLHWDSKLLPDLAANMNETVDRVAILVSTNGEEQLLAVPKMEHGTGQAQASACMTALDEWGVRDLVKGLVFNTTAANTGLSQGACTLIEEALGSEVAWLACRHHMFEIVLAAAFQVAMGGSSGPMVAMFQRFQKAWPSLDKSAFSAANNELFSGSLSDLRVEACKYLTTAVDQAQLRDDYHELLQLSLAFLSGGKYKPSIRAPGAMHHARWMSKAIYSLKIFLFKEQLQKMRIFSRREEAALPMICLFISLLYARFWNEAPLAARAPFNDALFLAALDQFPCGAVRDAAITAFRRHLWYFSEHLVALALFDDRVADSTKAAMVANFTRASSNRPLKRLDARNFDYRVPLESYVMA